MLNGISGPLNRCSAALDLLQIAFQSTERPLELRKVLRRARDAFVAGRHRADHRRRRRVRRGGEVGERRARPARVAQQIDVFHRGGEEELGVRALGSAGGAPAPVEHDAAAALDEQVAGVGVAVEDVSVHRHAVVSDESLDDAAHLGAARGRGELRDPHAVDVLHAENAPRDGGGDHAGHPDAEARGGEALLSKQLVARLLRKVELGARDRRHFAHHRPELAEEVRRDGAEEHSEQG